MYTNGLKLNMIDFNAFITLAHEGLKLFFFYYFFLMEL